MSGNSRQVSSNQTDIHPRLEEIVRRHQNSTYLKPVADHAKRAFDRAIKFVDSGAMPACLDSFCGTGMSTAVLASKYPDSPCIGIDQSASRLSKHGPQKSDNYILLQTDAGDFWRLAQAEGWLLQTHWLLYPNPWPKSSQLQRRIHGCPEFPSMLALGGELQCRSNWSLYLEELRLALDQLGIQAIVEQINPQPPLTLFEEKYRASGHSLWQCSAVIDAP
jgi:tRNA G46 methylase TrmB